MSPWTSYTERRTGPKTGRPTRSWPTTISHEGKPGSDEPYRISASGTKVHPRPVIRRPPKSSLHGCVKVAAGRSRWGFGEQGGASRHLVPPLLLYLPLPSKGKGSGVGVERRL